MSDYNSDEEEDEEKAIKLVFFGDNYSGKSAICFKLSQNKFLNEYVQVSYLFILLIKLFINS